MIVTFSHAGHGDHGHTPSDTAHSNTTRAPLRYPPRSSSWLRSCLEIVLPTQCRICRRPLRGTPVCYRCRPELPDLGDLCSRNCQSCFSPLGIGVSTPACQTCTLFPPVTDTIRFLWEYDGLARDLIRTIKYRPSLSLATLAGGLLCDAAPSMFATTRWDLIIPVPSSHAMFHKRLFHPCTELARPVARALNIPVIHALKHNSARAPQASLTHEERLRNLRTIFTVAARCDLRGARVLLVEDVITTGATITAAAAILKCAGARQIDVLALARTRVWSRFRHRLHETMQRYPPRSLVMCKSPCQ